MSAAGALAFNQLRQWFANRSYIVRLPVEWVDPRPSVVHVAEHNPLSPFAFRLRFLRRAFGRHNTQRLTISM